MFDILLLVVAHMREKYSMDLSTHLAAHWNVNTAMKMSHLDKPSLYPFIIYCCLFRCFYSICLLRHICPFYREYAVSTHMLSSNSSTASPSAPHSMAAGTTVQKRLFIVSQPDRIPTHVLTEKFQQFPGFLDFGYISGKYKSHNIASVYRIIKKIQHLSILTREEFWLCQVCVHRWCRYSSEMSPWRDVCWQ